MTTTTIVQPGEQIATVAHLRDVNDLPTIPLHVPWWDEDGTRCIIRVRGLTFTERRLVRQKAGDDPDLIFLYTCLYGIVEPKLDESQREILERRHPQALEDIAETIALLGKLDSATVLAHIRELTGLATASDARASAAA